MRALADYNEAIRLDPELAWVYVNRGYFRRDRREWDQALADFDEAIRLDPRNAYAHYSRAVVLFATRRGGAADEAKAVLDIQGWRGDLSTYAVLWAYFAALPRRPQGPGPEPARRGGGEVRPEGMALSDRQAPAGRARRGRAAGRGRGRRIKRARPTAISASRRWRTVGAMRRWSTSAG